MEENEIIKELDESREKLYLSNNLVEAKYKLGVTEQKIIHFILTQINQSDDKFKYYSLKANDFKSLINKTNNYKTVLTHACENLRKTDIIVNTEKSILKTTWFSSAEYFTNGTIELEISNKLKPYLLELKKCFTTYNYFNIMHFKSQYSIRIYQLLKQYEKIGNRKMDINELKSFLGITPNDYPQYSNFKQKILNKALTEINNLSDINFTFEEIKKGRKVEGLKFYIHSKEKQKNIPTEEIPAIQDTTKEDSLEEISILQDADDLLDDLREIIKEPLKTKELKTILKVADNNMDKIREKYQLSKTQNIKNLAAWLVEAIKEDYKIPESNKEKIRNRKNNIAPNAFHNFEQRDYDFDDIERRILDKVNKTKEIVTNKTDVMAIIGNQKEDVDIQKEIDSERQDLINLIQGYALVKMGLELKQNEISMILQWALPNKSPSGYNKKDFNKRVLDAVEKCCAENAKDFNNLFSNIFKAFH